jgi:hypothetical protein
MNIKIVKVILSIILFLSLFKMPYGYYQIVRFVAMVTFAYLAYTANEQNNKNEIFIYIALAILFQPFAKIAFGRALWNIIDLVVGVGLITSLFKSIETDNKK